MKAISVKGLVKNYDSHKKYPGFKGALKSFFNRENISVSAVSNISFQIEAGELIGFIGPNGAGKTTTLKVLSGLLYPTSGEVSVLGYKPWERKADYLRKISLVMGQKGQLWWDLPASDSFLLNKEIYKIDDAEYKKAVDMMVELLEFRDFMDIPVRKLSLGQRMKAELIAALLHKPKVIFLDEPTIGLDVVMQQRIRDFIKEMNKTHESTIMLTSHYMEDVKQLCKRVIMIHEGRLIFDGSIEKLIEKYAGEKIFEVKLEKEFDYVRLSSLGEVQEIEFPKLVLKVPREKAKETAVKLYQEFPVEDVNIGELSLTDVVKEYFK